jgi:alpha-mannosidase
MMKRKTALALFCFLVLVGFAPAQQAPAPTGCAAMLAKWRGIAVETINDWRWRETGDFRGEVANLDDSAWPQVQKGQSWESTTVWLRRLVTVPEQRGGYSFRGARLLLHVPGSWAGKEYTSVFVNGLRRADGVEIAPLVLTESAQPGERFLIAIRLQQDAGKFWPPTARVELTGVTGRPDVQTLLEECVAAETLNEATTEGKSERGRRIDAARKAIRWDLLEQGNQKAFDDSLENARAALAPLRGWMKSYQVVAVGNSHIDMAWLWPWTETVEVVRNTFSSVLKLMQEFPEFKFSHSSVQTYAWMEDKYPELFEQIRRRVKEGRWEVVGGMWVEPDLNMADGEALTRQILHGKRYIREKFGVDVRIGYNPDSFGYNWQLPQIYKRSGIDYFVTQKLGWNETNKFPHKLFWWEAPDGSRLLTFFPRDYVNSIEPVRMATDLADASRLTGLPRLLHLYGVGDHGGGPTRAMLESARKWQSPAALFPELKLSTLGDYFQQARAHAEKSQIPVWKDELYLEYHRGTFTTQARTKWNNRRNEALLLNAERFSSLSTMLGRAYPLTDLNAAWRKLLFNQFHDILPGSSIAVVYRDASLDHVEIRRVGHEILSGALDDLLERIRTTGPGIPVVVFNSLGWGRTDVVETTVSFPEPPKHVLVSDLAGEAVLSDVASRSADGRTLRIRFLAEDVPSFGYRTFRVQPSEKAAPLAPSVRVTQDSIENEFLRARVDPKTGCLTSLFDRRRNREVLAVNACGNLLQAFRDEPKDWDAWNIDSNFEDERWDLDRAEEIKIVEQSLTRAVLRVTKRFRKSIFHQFLTLYPGVPRLDVRMEADWHENRTMIKVAFPLAASSDWATFEIPYGSIQRPTTRNTPVEKAKFEVPALRWADLSGAAGGLSLLNDSKYGYDAKGNVLRLTLLRSPKWPDPQADMGPHEFTYSLFPHAGNWKDAGTVRRGYELNVPLIAVATHSHGGTLPPARSFIEFSAPNVVFTALKKAEDGESFLVRFYEFAGRETEVRFRTPMPVGKAVETDLMEQDERPLAFEGREVVVPTRPYEIKTVRIEPLRRP